MNEGGGPRGPALFFFLGIAGGVAQEWVPALFHGSPPNKRGPHPGRPTLLVFMDYAGSYQIFRMCMFRVWMR